MFISSYLAKQLWKLKKKPSGSIPRKKFKAVTKAPVRKIVPIVKNEMLQDGNILQSIIGATKPGSTKMQFPYEIPTINTSVDITPATQITLLGFAGLLSAGIVAGQLIKRSTGH